MVRWSMVGLHAANLGYKWVSHDPHLSLDGSLIGTRVDVIGRYFT
jgi:hypothetical protein